MIEVLEKHRWLRWALPISTIAVITLVIVVHAEMKPHVTIQGAGATFPYPLYGQWAYRYNQLTGVRVNYQSIGSGGGIAQTMARTIDFGASDAPLTEDELHTDKLVQFPIVLGGVVPVVNAGGHGPDHIRLSPEVLADIFLGHISQWNDPRITALNPGRTLPDLPITVVHRADGSGTTWIFTHYLSKISTEWSDRVGAGAAVSWPTGIGGKGNEGVASYVQRINGAIGYVEFVYAITNDLPHVLMQNQAEKFVEPTIETFQAAASNADWQNAPGFYMVLTDQPGEDSWPITGATFILMHAEQKNRETARAVLEFFHWGYLHGDKIATDLHYVPIPDNVVAMIENYWTTHIKADNQPVWSE